MAILLIFYLIGDFSFNKEHRKLPTHESKPKLTNLDQTVGGLLVGALHVDINSRRLPKESHQKVISCRIILMQFKGYIAKREQSRGQSTESL